MLSETETAAPDLAPWRPPVTRKLRVLVVDDASIARAILVGMLGQFAQLEVVGQAEDGASALALIERLTPDVVFLDIRLPAPTGLEVARRLMDLPRPPRIVFVSAHEGYAVEAFEVQAYDYLVKPVSMDRLQQTVARLEARFRSEARQSREQERLQRELEILRMESITDPLTGVYNRRFLDLRLQEEAQKARRHGHELALLLLDVDRFKSINDNLGHPAGDEVLQALAHTVRGELRATDVLARWGGEEFAVVLPDTGPEGALAAAEKVRAAVEQTPAGNGIRYTVSIGVASLGPEDGVEGLLEQADGALYRAKAAGRNRVCG